MSKNNLQDNLQQVVQNNTFNIIKQTRKLIKGMTQQQRFQKAVFHLRDAIHFRHPRPDAYNLNSSYLFSFCYKWQSSHFWNQFLIAITYIFFYFIVFDTKQHYTTRFAVQLTILIIYWLDVGLYLCHKSYQTMKITSKFQTRFYVKIFILIILNIDFILFAISGGEGSRYLRLFRFVRGLLPIFYDPVARKTVESFLFTYKQTSVFIFFYACMIVSCAYIASVIIYYPPGWQFDQYKQNYPNFVRCIYVIYGMLTQDNFPDNELSAIQWSQWTYAYFIFIVTLNRNFFTTIPGTIIYNSFRQQRSKTILMGQLRQQHSLILAFVTLAQDSYQIDTKTLVKFLLHMYHKKPRYIKHITQICIKLDYNNSNTIQVNQFMQLTNIMTKHPHLSPPQFDDVDAWIKFSKYTNQFLKFDQLVKTWWYRFVTTIIIILTFSNCIAYIVTDQYWLGITDNVFEALFLFELAIKLIGLGFIDFFNDRWNKLDFILILVTLILDVLPVHMIPHNADVLMKMFRFYHVTQLIVLYEELKGKKEEQIQIQNRKSMYGSLKKLVTQTALVVPITVQFFPLLLLSFYYLGLFGMEFFDDAQKYTQPTAKYGMYAQFDNFKKFLGSQYIMIQVLVQHGWSQVAFDYADRTKVYFPIVLYFMICHALITNILSSVLKSLVWDAYCYIHEQFQQNLDKKEEQMTKQLQNEKKNKQFQQIRQIIKQNQFIIPNTMIKRQFLQNKMDLQIFKRLKEMYQKQIRTFNKIHSYKDVYQQIVYSNKKYLVDQFSDQQQQNQQDADLPLEQTINKLYEKFVSKKILSSKFSAQESQISDFQQEVKNMVQKIILHPRSKYSETIIYPKLLLQLLSIKFIQPFYQIRQNYSKKFNLNKNILDKNTSALNYHTQQIYVKLQIERSQRAKKMEIIKYMCENQMITQQEAKKLFMKDTFYRTRHINQNWIIRKMFLGQTNQDLINKFQIEYFSNLYGQSFKDINKITIQPLLKYQALLTYNFRNILRYPQIDNNSFFQLLTSIEDKISNFLQKKGSLFKFVYQMQNFSDNWFTIEFNQSSQIKIRFIKSGIWVCSPTMVSQQIYYARDLFNWQINQRQDRENCQKILKLLYQTFQSLAFGLNYRNNFFLTNPVYHVYDLYSFFIDVTNQLKYPRPQSQKLKISKIMLVILSKQQQRQEPLDYWLSQIIQEKPIKRKQYFKFDESQNDAFEKLKNLSAMDHQKIIQNQGLPFAYVLNLMRQFKQCLTIDGNTFVQKVQKILNEQFKK